MSNPRVENQLKVQATKLVELSKAEGTEGVKLELRQAAKRLLEIEAKLSGKAVDHSDVTIPVQIKDGRMTVIPPGALMDPNFKKRMACSYACRNAGVEFKYEGKAADGTKLPNDHPEKGRFSVKATAESIKAVEGVLADFYPGASLLDAEGKVTKVLPKKD